MIIRCVKTIWGVGSSLKMWTLKVQLLVADAQNILRVMYANGQGVPEDHPEAAKW